MSVSVLSSWGLLGGSIPVAVFVTILLEAFGVPLPGESALIAASAAAGDGATRLSYVFVAAWAGAVIGDNIGYLIGRRYGQSLIERFGPRIGLTTARYVRVEAAARKYGVIMVMFARFFVVLRQFNGLVAGSTGMPWLRFLVANIVGAAAWAGVWTTVGDSAARWLTHHPNTMHFVPLLAISAVAIFIAMRLFRKRRPR
ncbi:DedA family protein [Thalassococcus sp. BH17M4-6]|uniref:DedA family protein n=1 Tax=Thalassococcus sp. BH17M4-6 TaxID=3413148 RepID=UPI003BCE43B9